MSTGQQRRHQLGIGLQRLSGMLQRQAWREQGELNLHPAQRALLVVLTSAPKGLRAGEVAVRLGVSAASISDTIRAAESKGWVQRTPDPDDARAWRLSLTRAGKTLVKDLQSPDRGLAAMIDALPEHDAAALLRILQLLIHEGQAQGLISGMRTCLGCEYFKPYASADADRPHICAFVGAPFGDAELRTDCAEQQTQEDPAALAENLLHFRSGAKP
jgi:DNA-binding MarR family transcriptional regulator